MNSDNTKQNNNVNMSPSSEPIVALHVNTHKMTKNNEKQNQV